MKRFGVRAVVALFFWIAFARDAKAAPDTNTIYLNNCQPSGCTVKAGTTNSSTDTSDIPSATSQLSAFSQSATVWASAVSCFQTVMSAFNVNITQTRPASGDYFEVMVAGLPTDLGLSSDQEGIADSLCATAGECSSPYYPHALVFVFANASFLTNDPNDICANIAQQLAATWTLDHVVDSTDVDSYNASTGMRAFHDGEACGSDCVGGKSPFGLTCTGSGGNATHACMGNNKATQDEVQTILALFGAAPPPTADAGVTDGGSTSDGGSTVDSGIAADGGATTDGGNATGDDAGSESAASDDGGCNLGGSSRDSYSFAGLAFVIAAIAMRRAKRRSVSP